MCHRFVVRWALCVCKMYAGRYNVHTYMCPSHLNSRVPIHSSIIITTGSIDSDILTVRNEHITSNDMSWQMYCIYRIFHNVHAFLVKSCQSGGVMDYHRVAAARQHLPGVDTQHAHGLNSPHLNICGGVKRFISKYTIYRPKEIQKE